jgi:adenine-specific DNA-methyltransferase
VRSGRFVSVLLPPSTCVVETPATLAAAVVDALRPAGDDDLWLDPCVGAGSLVSAMATAGVPSANIVALDIDPNSLPIDVLARTTRGEDFVAWAQATDLRFDRIVANPPYVGLDRLDEGLMAPVRSIETRSNVAIDGRGNYWLPFLIAAISLLEEGGSLGFILPASYEYADYSRPVHRHVARTFETATVVRSLTPLFPGLSDGCVVLLARGKHSDGVESGSSMRIEVNGLDELIGALLDPLPQTAAHPPSADFFGQSERFSDVIDLRIGAVTGDSKYFLMSEAQRVERNLPIESVVPVISHASDLSGPLMTKATWDHIRTQGSRCWMFRPTSTEAENVEAYLGRSVDQGGCRRTGWVTKRDPWYRVELPVDVHGFVSGMTRFGPRLVLNDDPSITATNTLYIARFLKAKSRESRAAWSIAILSTEAQEQLRVRSRLYPEGLRKLEPSDFNTIRLPVPADNAGSIDALQDVWKEFDRSPEAGSTMASRWVRTGSLVATRSAAASSPSKTFRVAAST